MLTNPQTANHKGKRIYTDAIGAGGGTMLLMFAESIPDVYWFKPFLIFITPSLSISFPKLSLLFLVYCRLVFDAIRAIKHERRIISKLKLLRRNPQVSPNVLKRVEQMYVAIQFRSIEESADKLSKLRK